MTSSLDVDLNDTDLITEIGLLTDLMLLASESTGPLDRQAIDETLGLWPTADLVKLPQQRLAC